MTAIKPPQKSVYHHLCQISSIVLPSVWVFRLKAQLCIIHTCWHNQGQQLALVEKNCSSPSQRGNDSSNDILPKVDLTARPNSPSNLSGPLQARNISRHFCGGNLRIKPHHVWTDGFRLFFCAFFSLLPDLVGLMPVRQLLQTKLAICLITDCCHDYGKQGEEQGLFFLFMNKHIFSQRAI